MYSVMNRPFATTSMESFIVKRLNYVTMAITQPHAAIAYLYVSDEAWILDAPNIEYFLQHAYDRANSRNRINDLLVGNSQSIIN